MNQKEAFVTQLQQFDVKVEDDDPIVVFGSNAELQKVKAFLEEKNFICDNGAIGMVPETLGMIMICYAGEDAENGYLLMPEKESKQQDMANKCATTAIQMIFGAA